MELKCNFNPYYRNNYAQPPRPTGNSFRGYALMDKASESADIFMRRPVAERSATGLRGLMCKVKQYSKNYVKNIEHTYDHKIVFAMIEKELFGKNSIDSLTHDADKLILYMLGFPKSFVSKWHREHSVHHIESGKKANLRSMICDNIASSPEFKPEKKQSLREYYNSSQELQSVKGFGELLEKYNYGENLNFTELKARKNVKFHGFIGMAFATLRTLTVLFRSGIESSMIM